MAEYIEKQAAIHAVKEAWAQGERPICWRLVEMEPADVVTRDCYDRILWENDVMRAQLAGIGKKFGEKMDNVRPVVRGRWRKIGNNSDGTSDYECSACLGIMMHVPDDDEHPMVSFCSMCGADMREGEKKA